MSESGAFLGTQELGEDVPDLPLDVGAEMAETRLADRPRIARRSSATTVGRSRMMASRSLETFLGQTADGLFARRRLLPALGEAAEGMMKMAMTGLNFNARAYDRILKVARTIADLAESETIAAEHVGEAIQYRTLDRNLWA